MNRINLNNGWNLKEAPLSWSKEYYAEVMKAEGKWYSVNLPADVHMPLIEAGEMKDPVLADYCREAEWVEDRSWWFVKHFEGADLSMENDIVELVVEGLDSRSDIFLNGHYLGCHKSVHYPFVCKVKEYLNAGDNVITVRMTSGLEEITREDVMELNDAVCLETYNGGKFRGDDRRSFVRRPQYTVGWDWGPKVITIGITGDVYLRSYKKTSIREVKLETVSVGASATLHMMANVENLDLIGSKSCSLKVRMRMDGILCKEEVKEQILLTSGYNYIDLEYEIENPKLWWPNGYGEHPLYQVEVEVVCENHTEVYPAFSYGIRTIELNTDVMQGEDRNFTFVVNGKPVYCKGGNWVPNDFIYARVPEEKYKVLIEEAVEANFNMLRVWGGGLYERELFYDLCDANGILIWHDFMFACSTYPDHHEWFRLLMWKELDYQTKRLRNHSSIALFCGTNEVHWIFNSQDNPQWGIEFTGDHPYGLSVPNQMAREIIRKNCANIPYWNSSPYGGRLPNDDTVGDVHRWHNALMSKKMEERIEPKDYDTIESKFVSEYGFIGPCPLESIQEYMDGASADGDAMDRTGDVWQMHSNVFEKGTVNEAIRKNYVDDPEKLSLEDYILYGGMAHALMYGYSLEAMRFKEHCSGGLFWMYNDAWGEVGWTIVDYYLRRKIPYYAVKRSLAHRKFTLRLVDQKVVLQGMNDTPEVWKTKVKIGYATFDGTKMDLKDLEVQVDAGSRNYLYQMELPAEDYRKGTVMLYAEDAESVWLRMDDMRNLEYETSAVEMIESAPEGDGWKLTVKASGFAHGVYYKGNEKGSDNYFDLLPGETKTVYIKGQKNAPEISQVR